MEEKNLFYRDCGRGIYQCYLPDCWGHDAGACSPKTGVVVYGSAGEPDVFKLY